MRINCILSWGLFGTVLGSAATAIGTAVYLSNACKEETGYKGTPKQPAPNSQDVTNAYNECIYYDYKDIAQFPEYDYYYLNIFLNSPVLLGSSIGFMLGICIGLVREWKRDQRLLASYFPLARQRNDAPNAPEIIISVARPLSATPATQFSPRNLQRLLEAEAKTNVNDGMHSEQGIELQHSN